MPLDGEKLFPIHRKVGQKLPDYGYLEISWPQACLELKVLLHQSRYRPRQDKHQRKMAVFRTERCGAADRVEEASGAFKIPETPYLHSKHKSTTLLVQAQAFYPRKQREKQACLDGRQLVLSSVFFA